MPDLLNISVSGLSAYQGALATTSHNIANVGNENYTRQRAELDARNPLREGPAFFGQGVDLTSVNRIIDQFNSLSLRDSTSNVGRLDTFESYAVRVESIVADEQSSLMPALDNYFNALNDVANDPSANAPRVALLGSAEILEQSFASIGSELQALESEINLSVRAEISEINSITTELASLNERISSVSAVGDRPSDLLDQRDALLKRLSEKIAVTVVEQADGNLNVLVGTGQLLVSGSTVSTLVAQQDAAQPDRISVGMQSSAGTVDVTDSLVGGDLGGLLDVRDSFLKDTQNRMGLLAISVAESMNAQHTQGYDLNGDFGTNQFSTVSTGHLQAQFGGDYLANGLAVGETISFDLQFDGRTVNTAYTVQVGDTNQDIANGLLFGATGIDNDANVTDNADGTYTLAGTTPGVSMTFELYGSNIKFETAGGPSPLGNNLAISNITDGATNNATLALSALGSSSTRATAGVVSTGNPATFIGPSTVATPNQNNTGTGVMNFSITDVSALTVSDYEVGFDGVNYNVVRLSDNVTVATGAGPFSVDGLEITAGGAAAAGDSFYIRPTDLGAVSFQALISDPAQIAAAGPVRATTNINNIGSIEISSPTVTDVLDGDLTDTVDIYFDPANPSGTFDVVDRASGTVLQNDVVYFNGININQNGWQIQLTGEPRPGDTFTVQDNAGAVADNRNALLLASLQTTGVLNNGNTTFEQSYTALTSSVGVVTQQVKIGLEVEESLLNSAIERRESVSGVNLDEEAANLIRYQQAYQALSRVIQVSQEIFDSLLNAV
ncbi:MAG: flagellar hook-associated protein FlgK [Gammaproteobacteria bacterium]|nr:flagellar hook-associated protein FlgK [Gammaproteobacteria bacterium]